MTIKRFTTVGSLLLLCSFLMTACSVVNNNSVDQNLPASDLTTEQQEEARLLQPQSDSTELDDLDKELTDFKVLEEDFSDL